MSFADVLLAAGVIPAAYVAYWMFRGLFFGLANGKRATVTLRVGGPCIFLVLAASVAGIVGTALTLLA